MNPAEKLEFTQNILKNNPSLCKNHFVRKCGIGRATLNKWEAQGLVKFGKPKKQQSKFL